jgi:RNA polymerase sigma-70 factor (ECF subfamily)
MTNWENLVREHGPATFWTAWRILGHAADAEDVVQEVFLQAHQLQQRLEVRCWKALLCRLAAYRAYDHLRARRATEGLDGLELPSRGESPEETQLRLEFHAGLRAAIACLPRQMATVFCLRYFEELSTECIADTLHISQGAVAVALHKARTRLVSLLDRSS